MSTLKIVGATLVALVLSLKSFAVSLPNKIVEPVVATTTIVAPTSTKYSYKQMKQLVEAKTGKKLSFGQKVALRLTSGKLNKAFSKMGNASGGKSQLVAALLCFFIGGLGIHDFYLGRTINGIAKILLLILGVILIIPLIALSIWCLVDLVRILIGDMKPKSGDYEKTL